MSLKELDAFDEPEPREEAVVDADGTDATEVDDEMTPNPGATVSGTDRGMLRATGARTQMDPVRLAEIRQRILDGAYNSLETVEQVARRILASGDL